MLKVFTGEDRVSAEKAVQSFLGVNYEVFEGENLSVGDLPSIFQGMSLFTTGRRKILLKNLSENTAVFEKIGEYAETEHKVAVWEIKIDKRLAGYKNLKAAGVTIREFTLGVPPEARLVFGILDMALKDGKRAVAQVEKIEREQDAFIFFGLMVTQAMKKFEQGSEEEGKKLLKGLAELDMRMKTTGVEAWVLIKAFLLRVKTLS